jgi:hypothetical protein
MPPPCEMVPNPPISATRLDRQAISGRPFPRRGQIRLLLVAAQRWIDPWPAKWLVGGIIQ